MDRRNIGCEDVNWVQLSQDMAQCWVFVVMVMSV